MTVRSLLHAVRVCLAVVRLSTPVTSMVAVPSRGWLIAGVDDQVHVWHL